MALGADGIIHGAVAGTIYADLSTGSPTVMRRLHAAFKAKGIHVLDAPVSGGVWGAQRGTLQVMVGGDESIYNEVKSVLQAIGDKVGYMGPIGAGTIAAVSAAAAATGLADESTSNATYFVDIVCGPRIEGTPTFQTSRSSSRTRSTSITPSKGSWMLESVDGSCVSFSTKKSAVTSRLSSFAFVTCMKWKTSRWSYAFRAGEITSRTALIPFPSGTRLRAQVIATPTFMR